MAPRERFVSWNLWVLLLVLLSVFGPLMFGLPVIGHLNGSDSNFALDLTRGYMDALRAGQWFPRWLPASNAGMGSPVFYFYGRLPFLVAAILGLGLHLHPVGALLAAFALFRLLAFYSCRSWLRAAASPRAADCGALLFLVMPYTMSLNTITRVGFAETAATAFLPWLFLWLDKLLAGRQSMARTMVWLGLTYAVIAWCHAPQLVLALVITSFYLLLRRSLPGLVANLAGLGVGALLAAPSALPALLLQGTISSEGWRNNDHLLMKNNFLFTAARRYFYGLYAIDMDLYATWLICLLVLLMYFFDRRRQETEVHRRGRAAAETVAVILVAVTGLARAVWLFFPSLQVIQFPWRLFPGGVTLVAALLALWIGFSKRRMYGCLIACGCLAAGQVGFTALGAAVSLTHWRLHFARRVGVSYRLPTYTSWTVREEPAFARRRSFVPEYLPAAARQAGWRLSFNEEYLLPGPATPTTAALTSGLQEWMEGNGTLHLTVNLPSPKSLELPLFYYPDENVQGAPGLAVRPDPRTGLATIDLPAGPVTLTVAHDATLAPVRWSHLACILGLALLLLCTLFARRAQPVREA